MLTGQPVLTDARGKYVAAIFVVGEACTLCISDGHDDASGIFGGLRHWTSTQRPAPISWGCRPVVAAPRPVSPAPTRTSRCQPEVLAAMQANPDLKNNPTLLAKRRGGRRSDRSGRRDYLVGLAGSDIAACDFRASLTAKP